MRFLSVAAALVVWAAAAAGGQAPDVKIVTGAMLINPGVSPPVANAVIVINGARITQAGPGASIKAAPDAEVIDARGKFVIPGLADMHNHLDDGGTTRPQNKVANLGRVLGAGVTTVFNPSVPERDFQMLKAAAAPDTSPYARFFGAGPGLTADGDQLGALNPKPKTVAEAQAIVQKLKSLNVDAIKVMRDDLAWSSTRRMEPMPLEVLHAVVDEAHRLGLKVFAHAPQLLRAREALRAGVDGLLHGIIDEAVDENFIGLMNGVFLGAASQVEMELMVEAGLTPAQAIGAATINAARMLGRENEQGSVEAGKLADLLILDANPLTDIRAVRQIHRVVKGGMVHDPAKLPR